MRLAEDLATTFLLNGWEWKIGGELAIPNADDIQKAVDHAVEILENEESQEANLEFGRLMFKKREGVIDVFVCVGTIGEE